ncbi:hypothetical protein K4F52_009631 [Lecanicillium sp. MT-2017a]|nr:hypothetical protein K4F52_009631 [Lecanicillium sp. MT-2017a]
METVLQLARHNPSKIFLAARSGEKAEEAIISIKKQLSNETEIYWLPLDLMSVDSIKEAAKIFEKQSPRLDCLILNAGVMCLPPGKTRMGHDVQFGTNHTGHFLLTQLLLPTLLKTAETKSDVRVVTIASVGYNLAPAFSMFLDQEKLSKADPYIRYGASKASNILFAAELARRYPSLTSVSVHPGIIITGLYESVTHHFYFGNAISKVLSSLMTQIPAGAFNQLWASVGVEKSELENGAYYVPVGHHKPYNQYSTDKWMARTLWDWTEAELRRFGALEYSVSS